MKETKGWGKGRINYSRNLEQGNCEDGPGTGARRDIGILFMEDKGKLVSGSLVSR